MKKIFLALAFAALSFICQPKAQTTESGENQYQVLSTVQTLSVDKIKEKLNEMASFFEDFLDQDNGINNLENSLELFFEQLATNLEQLEEGMEKNQSQITILSNDKSNKKSTSIISMETDSTLTIQIGGIDKRKSNKLTTSDLLFGIGPTYFLENQAPAEYYPEMRPWSSWSGFTGFQWTSRLGKNSPLAIQYGMVYQWRIMNTNENASLTVADKRPIYLNQDEAQIAFSKSSLRSHYLTLPIHLQFSNKKGEGLMASVGGYAGLRLGDTQVWKYKSSIGENVEAKLKHNYRTNPLIYGLSVQVGTQDVRGYVNYDVSNIWNNAEVYDVNRVNFGILFLL
jgi:hypothetical protein